MDSRKIGIGHVKVLLNYLKKDPPTKSKNKKIIFRVYLAIYMILEYIFGSYLSVKLLEKIRKIRLKTELKNGLRLFHKIEQIPYLYELCYSNLPTKIKKNAIIFDVGAHIGTFSLKISKKLKKGQVFAFEPNKENYRFLLRNIELNNLNNIIIPINQGISNTDKTAKLYLSNGSGGHSIHLTKSNRYEKIRIINLDKFIESRNIKNIDLIKIDAEGEELNVIKGSKNILKEFKPSLIIELHPWFTSTEKLIKELRENRYKIKVIDKNKIFAFPPYRR